MDYRGTVQGGVVVLDPGNPLPEGQVVEVTPVLAETDADELPAAGLWRDRVELDDTAMVAPELRRATNQRTE